jgi:hypothetical protein
LSDRVGDSGPGREARNARVEEKRGVRLWGKRVVALNRVRVD